MMTRTDIKKDQRETLIFMNWMTYLAAINSHLMLIYLMNLVFSIKWSFLYIVCHKLHATGAAYIFSSDTVAVDNIAFTINHITITVNI